MADYSAHYGLIILNAGDNLSEDDYAFTNRNIRNIDHKLYLGAESHQHTGESAPVVDPDTPLSLTLTTGSGNIPAGRTVRYRYTWVDANGAETGVSPEATVTTPSPVSAPGSPGISKSATGGTLLPGNYFYVLTAYKTSNTLETTPGGRVYTSVLSGTTNSITLDLPSVPAGADGFNVYRRGPGEARFFYLASIDMSIATPPTEYLDDGSVEEDCNRSVPTRNTTSNLNSVDIALPGATPAVPDGYTWRIYRTYTLNDWDSSLLSWVVEETSEGSGIITPTYTDVGSSTTAGSPPTQSEIVGSPTKINFTDAAEIQGSIPPGMNYYPHEVIFSFAGPLEPQDGEFKWRMPFTEGYIEKVTASLGVDSLVAGVPVQVNIRKYDTNAATPTWSSIFATPYLEIPVGEDTGSYPLVEGNGDVVQILEGEYLIADLIQSGGGATPTDENCTIQVVMWVKHGSSSTSFTW